MLEPVRAFASASDQPIPPQQQQQQRMKKIVERVPGIVLRCGRWSGNGIGRFCFGGGLRLARMSVLVLVLEPVLERRIGGGDGLRGLVLLMVWG